MWRIKRIQEICIIGTNEENNLGLPVNVNIIIKLFMLNVGQITNHSSIHIFHTMHWFPTERA